MNRKYKQLIKNTSLFAIGSFGTKILSFVLTPFYTSFLSTKDYGTADIITTTTTLLIYILTLNIGDAVMRFIIEDGSKKNELLTFGTKIICLGALLLAAVLSYFAYVHFFQIDTYCYVFLWLSFTANSFYTLLNCYLQGLGKVSNIVTAGIIQSLTMLCLNIFCLAVFHLGIYGYLISTIAGSAAAFFYECIIIMQLNSWHFRFISTKRTICLQMLSYSIPLIFNSVAWWMNASIDKYFVTGICGVDQNGIYSASSKVSMILSTCASIFLQAWGLSAIREFDPDDSDGFFSITYGLFNTMLVILCSLLIVVNIPVSRLLLAKKFYDGWQYSSILIFSAMFSSLGGFAGSLFGAVKDTKTYAVSTVGAAIVNVCLNFILIPVTGPTGAAIATVISFMFVWCFRLIISHRYIKWKISLTRDIICYLLLALQLIAEHSESHLYLLQLVILSFLIVLNYKEIYFVIIKMLKNISIKK